MKKRVIVALDFPTIGEAIALSDKLNPDTCRLKIGFELFMAGGPFLTKYLILKGFDIFLDWKLHDIPNTVASVCKVANKLGVWMLNVHASGDQEMMKSARKAISDVENRPKIIGVTVLTSFDDESLQRIGVNNTVNQQVKKLALLAKDSGLDGVVCSPQEALMLRKELGKDFLLVTPGIRLKGQESNDQKRTMTPSEAIKAGADYLVIGRPITRAREPLKVLESINVEIVDL